MDSGFETPNTRSRRKRELDMVDEAVMLGWKGDEGLRRAVLKSSEGSVVLPPTPTQKPRPISARLASSPSELSSSASTCASSSRSASARPRKRACRTAKLTTASSFIGQGSSSSANGDKLDYLLAQFDLNRGSQITRGSPLRPLNNNVTHPSPLRRTTTGSSESIKMSGLKLDSESASGGSLSRSGSGSFSASVSSGDGRSFSRGGSSSSLQLDRPCPPRAQSLVPLIALSSLSPVKTVGNGPRIGLSTNTGGSKREGRALSRQFKSPVIMTPPTRSSPRRHHASHARSSAAINVTPVRAMAREQVPKLAPVTRQEPSSDGPTTGDESFDSFDGMFDQGGPEIEALLRKVDGS